MWTYVCEHRPTPLMLFEYISMGMRCLSRPTLHLSVVDQSHSISCFWRRRRSHIEQAGWLRASVGLKKTEWEGKKERREWVWQMSSTVGWSDSWLTVKAAAPLRPSLEGLIHSAFALCVPLNLSIILGETDSRPFQTERQTGVWWDVLVYRLPLMVVHNQLLQSLVYKICSNAMYRTCRAPQANWLSVFVSCCELTVETHMLPPPRKNLLIYPTLICAFFHYLVMCWYMQSLCPYV